MSSISSMPLSLTLVSVGVMSGVANPVAAQSANEDTALVPVIVQGDLSRSTATKSALEPSETPGSVDVVDREAIETRGGDSISEALRYTPGVTPELRGGAVTRLDQYSIRGFQEAKTAYDGLLLLNNGWNLVPQIDPWAVEAIEVFKGPTSVLYGNQPPGGLVNLIAKQPDTARYNDLRVEFGTRELLEAKGEFTGTIGDPSVSYNVVALGRQRDGQAVTS